VLRECIYPPSVEEWTECAQTHTQTKVKTVYPPVSLGSLGGYNECVNDVLNDGGALVQIVTFRRFRTGP